jgi:hypothetical protein
VTQILLFLQVGYLIFCSSAVAEEQVVVTEVVAVAVAVAAAML